MDKKYVDRALDKLWLRGVSPAQAIEAIGLSLPLGEADAIQIARWAGHSDLAELRALDPAAPLLAVRTAQQRRREGTRRPDGWGEEVFARSKTEVRDIHKHKAQQS